MSIPPLVCSTPPPPDQCEDDKEHEDFGFQYNLSQEEDDDYDFGNFSTYNHYQASKPENAQSPAKSSNENKEITINLTSNEIEKLPTSNVPSLEFEEPKTKLKLEDELNIEDLNLGIENEIVNTPETEINEIIETKDDVVDSLTNIPSEDGSKETPINENTQIPEVEDYIVQSTILNNNNESKPILDAKIETVDIVIESDPVDFKVDTFKDDEVEDVTSLDVKFDDEIKFTEDITTEIDEIVPTALSTTEVVESVPSVISTIEIEETIKTDDDDFGDFEDFQTNTNVATAIDTANPWENSAIDNDDDFGDFKANFSEGNNLFKSEEVVHSKEDCNIQSEINDNDFGDFDDFQSSVNQEECQSQIPVLNLQSSQSESQIIETIDKVIRDIFEDEIQECGDEFGMKLEACLGVTWGHLLETDVRQPYIVPWNNSAAQKMLLKALCIDSRNILFAPKWNYNMPKYAVNLSVAPLQPQKQVVTSSAIPVATKEPPSKSGTWSDPFTADSQESNPETSNEAAALPIGPTDLDVFEASTSKPDKIYSNTINIQPIRQISLPDTHIFTPTDSETPRSKTIHYDNNPPLHLPQTPIDIKSVSHSHNKVKSVSDDDYWEFQDFKGAPSNEPVPSTSKAFEKADVPSPVTYATQVLQPVKIEPIIPTLNWPAPGEVKETFDDFSSFVSSTSWSTDQQESSINPIQIDKLEIEKPNISAVSNVAASDDDFDTFQSALPESKPSLNTIQPSPAIPTLSTPQSSISNSTRIPQNFNSFENSLPKLDTVLPSSTAPLPKLNDSLPSLSSAFVPTNTENISKNKENTVLPTLSNNSTGLTLLQPIQASSVKNNQSKTTQILQPLSLENYSQINWPNPGIDLQDLSRFNPVNTLQNLKSDSSSHGTGSPVHGQKGVTPNQVSDDDWGEFVSSRPSQPPPKKPPVPLDNDEWTDFISSPIVKPQNGLSTISLNVHTNLTSQKAIPKKVTVKNQVPLEIPSLNYVTPKSTSQKTYNARHFQNL